jgi:predicted metal-dependent hydrolase
VIGFLRPLNLIRAAAPAPEPQTIEIDGRQIELRFKRNARAKRMVLRLDAKNGGLVMTLPKRASLAEALKFAQLSSAWITRTFAKQKPKIAIADGAEILFRGEKLRLVCLGGARGLIRIADGVISVPGDLAHVERRLLDYFKKQALGDLTEASRLYAGLMGTKYSRLTIRDQRSRWGSCSASGALNYSWRLVLAPIFVLDYVAAHEVAHLLQMNHGPKFWRLVLTHCPHSRQAKEWLKHHGRELHRSF